MSSSGHSTNSVSTTTTSTSISTSSSHAAESYRMYPAPPPTVNRLSSRQKAQLRRSTTKLARVLGEAPQVVDEMPSKLARSVSAPRKLQPSLSITSTKSRSSADSCAVDVSRRKKKVDPELYPLSSTLRPTSSDVVLSRSSLSSSSSAASRARAHADGHVRRSTESRNGKRSASSGRSRRRSRSMSSEFLVKDDAFAYIDVDIDEDEDVQSSFVVISRPTRVSRSQQARPDSIMSTKSRDSLCDSLLEYGYEPTFRIPSASKMKREKMARVCKLLGEDVPVHLVFPAPERKRAIDDRYRFGGFSSSSSSSEEDEDGFSEIILDICAPAPRNPKSDSQTPPPVPPKNGINYVKRKPVPKAYLELEIPLPMLVTKELPIPEEPEEGTPELHTTSWTVPPAPTAPLPMPASTMTYRAPRLETIMEQSPRTSYSSSASSVDITRGHRSSANSFTSTTTSSSYRFFGTSGSSLGCLSSSDGGCSSASSPISADSHGHAYEAAITGTQEQKKLADVAEMSSGTPPHGRREFAIYAPFRRQKPVLNGSCQAQFASANPQERELVRGMVDLRV